MKPATKTGMIFLAAGCVLLALVGLLVWLSYPSTPPKESAAPRKRKAAHEIKKAPVEDQPEEHFEKLNTLRAEMEQAMLEADQLERQAERETNPTDKVSLIGRAALKRAEQRAKDREIKERMKRRP
jgi:hypothetical protein